MNLVEALVALYLSATLDIGTISNKDLVCMTTNIWHESRGERSTKSYIGVAQTVRNRIKRKEFPNTPCRVINARGAFEWTEDDLPDDVVPLKLEEVQLIEEMINISALALAGNFDGILQGAVHYYNPKVVTPCWKSAYKSWLTIGNHDWGLEPVKSKECWDARNLAAK